MPFEEGFTHIAADEELTGAGSEDCGCCPRDEDEDE